MGLILAAADHPDRALLESRIAAVYRREYGAVLRGFPPLLLALTDETGAFTCAAGVRFSQDRFFSECYLDEPVEEALSRASGRKVWREAVAEVVHLAAFEPGAGTALIHHIVAYCRENGADWAFFTATSRLRALLRRSGLVMVDLAPASVERVGASADWGRYYECGPRVTGVQDAMVPWRDGPDLTRLAYA